MPRRNVYFMIWSRLFKQSSSGLPETTHTLLIAEASAAQAMLPLAQALQQKFGDLGIGWVGKIEFSAFPNVELDDSGVRQIRKLRLQRVIALGDACAALIPDGCAAYVVNAAHKPAKPVDGIFVADPALAAGIPDAIVSGDPLANITELAAPSTDTAICERFLEQRQGGRWIGYFAATGEGEEDPAYLIFNRLIRHKMGLMVLAPFDPARCEPVYREAIKYRLQTIRHNRLSTSFVPIKTRVYYVEDAAARNAMYACCDWVVVGGTLADRSNVAPDIVTPLQLRRPVVVGPHGQHTPVLQAAIRAGVVLSAASEDELFAHLKHIIDAPEAAAERTEHAYAWLAAQPGALPRVIAGIA